MNVVHQWWQLPADYGWNIAYARSQSALGVTKILIGLWTWLYGVAAVFALVNPAIGDTTAGRVSLLAGLITTIPVGAMWIFGGWPKCSTSVAFVIYADIGVAAVLVTLGSAATMLPLAALFTVVGSYVAGFHGPKLFAVHQVLVLATVTIMYWFAFVDEPEQRFVTTMYLVVLFLVLFGAPLIIQVYVMLLRRDASGAFYDPLTGLQNRRGLDAGIGRLDSAAVPELSVLVIDLDNFKSVNDRFGHECGDTAIRLSAQRVSELFPVPAISVRLGGEEFAVIAVDGHARMATRAEELRVRLADPTDHAPVTASIGLAHARIGGIDADFRAIVTDLLDRADTEMYRAKRLGGNRVAGLPDNDSPAVEITAP